MNQVVNRTAGSAVAALQSLSQGLSNVVATIPTSSRDPYLRMQTDGVWVYGQDNIEVENGSLWAINIFSFKHGYASWTDHPKDPRTGKQPKNEKVGEIMVGMQEAKPIKTSLEDTGWDWADQVSVMLKCVHGEDKGEQVLFNTTSKGGLNALAKLIDAVQKQLIDDISHPVPVVELLSDSYKHETYGKTYVPLIEIRKWASLDDADDTAGGEIEDVKDAVVEEPAKPTRKRTASVPTTKQPDPEQVAQAVEKGERVETVKERALRMLAEAEAEEAAAAEQKQADVQQAQAEPAAAGQPEIRRRRRAA